MTDDAIRKLRLDTIRIVADVLRTRSLTQVAQLSGMTQPAVSVHIRKFEEATDLQVVRRVGNEFVPSVHAEHILSACQGILHSAAQLSDYSRLHADRRKRVGMDHTLFSLFERNEAALARLFERYLVVVDGADRLIERFAEAQLDAVVRPLFTLEAKPDLAFDSPFCWVGTAGSGLRGGVPVILQPRTTPYGALARAYLSRHAKNHEVVAETGDRATLLRLVQVGAGFAYVPEFAAADYAVDGAARLPVSLCHAGTGSFGVFHHKSEFSFPEAEALFSTVEQPLQTATPVPERLRA